MGSVDFGHRLEAFASKTYRKLRPAQEHVLDTFAADQLTASDVSIELPTGTGKTLVGLLLADWALDQGMAVAYLTGTNQLAEQVAEQAAALGTLEISRFWGGHYPGSELSAYQGAQAVGLMNYWVYFNSRPVVKPADLVIFDDAHIAEHPLSALFTLRIARGRWPDVYEGICNAVLAHTGKLYESLSAMRDNAATASTAPELLAFNDWAAVAPQVQDLIAQSQFVQDKDVAYVWPELRGRLDRCGVLIGPAAVEIRPYHPPTQTLPGYSQSRQRIYLSATLGTEDDLQRRLGVKTLSSIVTPAALAHAKTGRRLFLVNPSRSPSDSTAPLEFAMRTAGKVGRAAWLCSSNAEADEVERSLSGQFMTYRLRGGDDSELESWRTSKLGHLVTAGRFDGFDFRGETCRLVILPSVPAASTEFERFAVAYLGDAAFMRHRVGQRVTQALGRANRDEQDWAIYLGLDPGFAAILSDPAVSAAIADDAKPTVQVALEHHNTDDWASLDRAIDSFVGGASIVPQAVGKRPGRRVMSSTSQSETAPFEVDAVTGLWLGDYQRAAESARQAAECLASMGEPEHGAFWQYVRAHALWCSGRAQDLSTAKAALREAVTGAPNTSWFIRLRRTVDELEERASTPTGHDTLFLAWEEWMRESGSRVLQELTRARTDLGGTHDQRAQALETFGRLCGAVSDRPTGNSAPDGRWRWVNSRRGERRLWEIKTGDGVGRIARTDVNQALGQVTAEKRFAHGAAVYGCVLSPHSDIEGDAAMAALNDLVLLQSDAVVHWFDLMSDCFRDYVQRRGTGSALERGEARTAVEGRLPKAGWLERLLSPSHGRVRVKTDIDIEFVRG